MVPTRDPFSNSMPGAVWTAHEWLSEVILAAAHQAGGWTAVVALTALAFSVAMALLTRALLKSLEPIYALLFAALAVSMSAGHLLARPHVLAMPLMLIWTIELVRASEEARAPRLWLLPLMTVWANLHGGFTLGIALAFAFAFESLLAARAAARLAGAAKSWALFLVLAIASALVTPHGTQGILYTWQIFFHSSYALQVIGEWQSPNFHTFQPLALWLVVCLATVMYRGLRFPPVRVLLVVALLYLALKHIRYVELIGLLVPLFIATPLAVQWRASRKSQQQLEVADRFFRALAQPAGKGALLAAVAFFVAMPLWISHARPIEAPEATAPVLAVEAAQKDAVKGNVLNAYNWGGYLIYVGIPPFIDGRAEMYGDQLLKEYAAALALTSPDSLEKLIAGHEITWTLLAPDSAAVALLDRLPGWRRLYSDTTAVVHVKAGGPGNGARSLEAAGR